MSAPLQIESELVKHVRAGQPIVVTPDTTIRTALDKMKEGRQGSALVTDTENRLLGIFTERDALKILAAGGEMNVAIESAMTKQPKTVQDNDSLAQAIKLMASGGYRRLPVLDDTGAVAGILKVSHVLRYVVEHVPGIVYNLPPTPHHTTQNREGA